MQFTSNFYVWVEKVLLLYQGKETFLRLADVIVRLLVLWYRHLINPTEGYRICFARIKILTSCLRWDLLKQCLLGFSIR